MDPQDPFSFTSDAIELPPGAWAKCHRRSLRRNGRDILALTQGAWRSYLFPVYTPAGFAVTAESPADHPHHDSIWIAADHVHALLDVGGGRHEEYTYNFYVNEVFQGRAPGRIVETTVSGRTVASDHFRIEQTLQWLGPTEWAAPAGRVVLEEERVIDVKTGERRHLIDLRSRLKAIAWDVKLGPTRHGFFNVRVAESMRVARGGRLIDAEGREGGAAITAASSARWADFSGPVGGGQTAGITIVAGLGVPEVNWFAADWGNLTLQPVRVNGRLIRRNESFEMGVRLIIHDGSMPDTEDLAL